MLVAVPTLTRHDLLNVNLKELAGGLAAGDRLLVLDNGTNQPIALDGSRVQIVRSPFNLGVPGSWNFFLRRAFVEETFDALTILGDDVRMSPAQVVWAKMFLVEHPNVDLFLSYSNFDVQVHRKSNIRTIVLWPDDPEFGINVVGAPHYEHNHAISRRWAVEIL